MPEIKAGTADITTYLTLVDPASFDEEINLVISDLTMFYIRNRVGDVNNAATALANASDTHTDWRMFEVDSDQAPGIYRADYPDAAFGAGVDKVIVGVRGAAINTTSQLWQVKDFDISDIEDYVSDIYSDLAIIQSDLVVIDTDTSDIKTKLDSDAVLADADHDKTQSDVGDLSLKLASDVLALETAIDSDVLALETALDSDFLAVETKINSDAVLEVADHDKTQSDVADLSTKQDSDMLLMQSDLSDILSDTAGIATLSTKVDSDAVLADADHDKSQSDIADLSIKLASDVVALETALDSDFLAVETKLDSDALLGISDLSDVISDLVLIDQDLSDIKTKLDSDAVLADADHDKTQSDIAEVDDDTVTALFANASMKEMLSFARGKVVKNGNDLLFYDTDNVSLLFTLTLTTNGRTVA